MAPKPTQWWLPLALFLVLASAVGGVLLYSSLRGSQPVEITVPTPTPAATGQVYKGQVYIGGEVANPGRYPVQGGERLDDLLKAAGGVTGEADPNRITITVPSSKCSSSQKININTAAPCLLDTLPGIGPVLAQAIVDYRIQNGPFRSVEDVLKVPGIGPQTYDSIKNLITVGDVDIVLPTPTPTPSVPRSEEVSAPQKININRAEPWLLKALPDIGPVLARAIVDYRTKNGPFRTVQDITKVPGIGPSIYEKIEKLITVGD